MKNVGMHETVDQGRHRIERETKLCCKINAWIEVHQLFIPEVALLQEHEDTAWKQVAATQVMPGIRAQDMKLWLPSAIGTCAQCDVELLQYEYELCKGQVFAVLEEIRGQLLMCTYEYKYKDKSLPSNKAKTRSATRTKAIDARIEKVSEEYMQLWCCSALL
jgi:hypothetical protein